MEKIILNEKQIKIRIRLKSNLKNCFKAKEKGYKYLYSGNGYLFFEKIKEVN